jgi:hypothetical protein
MKNIIFITLIILIQVNHSFAQVIHHDSLVSKAFGNKTELNFYFEMQPAEIMEQLTRIISIDNVKNSQVYRICKQK